MKKDIELERKETAPSPTKEEGLSPQSSRVLFPFKLVKQVLHHEIISTLYENLPNFFDDNHDLEELNWKKLQNGAYFRKTGTNYATFVMNSKVYEGYYTLKK